MCDDFDDSDGGLFAHSHWTNATGDVTAGLDNAPYLSAPYSLKIVTPDPFAGTVFRLQKDFGLSAPSVITCELDMAIDSAPLNPGTGGSYMIRITEGDSRTAFLVEPSGPAVAILSADGGAYTAITDGGWPARYPVWHHMIITANYATHVLTASFDGQAQSVFLPSPTSPGTTGSGITIGSEVAGGAGNPFNVLLDNVLVTATT